MDDYSKQTIELLLERDRPYLATIIREYTANLPKDEDLTFEYVANTLASVAAISVVRPTKMPNASIYTCTQCKSKNIATRDVQMRSADEGSTILFICKECGHRWI